MMKRVVEKRRLRKPWPKRALKMGLTSAGRKSMRVNSSKTNKIKLQNQKVTVTSSPSTSRLRTKMWSQTQRFTQPT